jgi:parvulin-like peptidyl-prolyl isomerase
MLRRNQFIASLVLPTLLATSTLAQQPPKNPPLAGRTNPATNPAAKPAAGAQPVQANVLDKFPPVLAVVNDGQTISREKIADACIQRFGTIVLDNLLNKQLILQACDAKGIKITQADVNNEIDRVATKLNLSPKLFLETLEKERDIPPDQYASEVVWPMLALRALAADKIAVSPQEIEKVIQSEYGPKVSVRIIAVSQAEKAQELHRQVAAQPEIFRRVAKEHSEDGASASVEGLLAPIRQNGGDDPLEKVAFQLKENEISPVFQVGEMHVILQCIRHYAAAMPEPQVLVAIKERIVDQLRDQRLGKAADELFAVLQKTSKVTPVIGNPQLEQQYPGIAGFINNQPVARDQLAKDCIERHGRQVLRGEINRLLLGEALKKASLTITEADIKNELASAADGMGYLKPDGTPDIDAWLKTVMEDEKVNYNIYIQDAIWPAAALKKLAEGDVQITDDDLKKGYEANFGPRAEVLVIVLSNQRDAENVFRQARQSLTEKSFSDLAAKFSVEPVSRSNFGKIPPLRRHGGMPTIEKEAFALKPGEISGVIAWNEQFCILYKQGETKPIVQDFPVVKDEIYKEIRNKKLAVAVRRKMDSLLKSANIENYLEGSVSAAPVVQASATGAPAKPSTLK